MRMSELRRHIQPRRRLRTARTLARVARGALPNVPRDLAGPYFIRAGYVARERPEYSDDLDRHGVVWQPDVYPLAASVARRQGASTLVDVGCGAAAKLSAFHPEFRLFGLDFGKNLEVASERFPFGHWIEHDLDEASPLPVEASVMEDSVVIASDVIEHLVRPEHLLSALHDALTRCKAIIMSTPERDLTYGVENMGPPGNPRHVREWTIAEFSALLAASGFHNGEVSLTRSNDRNPWKHTILAVMYPPSARPR